MPLEIHPPLPAMEAKLVDSVPVGDEWHEATVRTLADPTRTTSWRAEIDGKRFSGMIEIDGSFWAISLKGLSATG
jgi:hypothetical protein